LKSALRPAADTLMMRLLYVHAMTLSILEFGGVILVFQSLCDVLPILFVLKSYTYWVCSMWARTQDILDNKIKKVGRGWEGGGGWEREREWRRGWG
jgi:hypothetical protein